jgi:hypothetical protein
VGKQETLIKRDFLIVLFMLIPKLQEVNLVKQFIGAAPLAFWPHFSTKITKKVGHSIE